MYYTIHLNYDDTISRFFTRHQLKISTKHVEPVSLPWIVCVPARVLQEAVAALKRNGGQRDVYRIDGRPTHQVTRQAALELVVAGTGIKAVLPPVRHDRRDVCYDVPVRPQPKVVDITLQIEPSIVEAPEALLVHAQRPTARHRQVEDCAPRRRHVVGEKCFGLRGWAGWRRR